jgi:hypothetical protein
VTRQWLRPMVVAVSLAVVLGAASIWFAAPVSAASGDPGSVAAATRTCDSSSDMPTSTVNPLNGTTACTAGPTRVEQSYEAAIAAAGLLALGGATLIYHRRHPRGPRGLGPRAPQG